MKFTRYWIDVSSSLREDISTEESALTRLGGPELARVPHAGMIDCRRFSADLHRMVETAAIHQKKAWDWMSHLPGDNDGNLVPYSGMVARCINLQPDSRLAQTLGRAPRERLTYGIDLCIDEQGPSVGRIPNCAII
jgi:hypothetical protein